MLTIRSSLSFFPQEAEKPECFWAPLLTTATLSLVGVVTGTCFSLINETFEVISLVSDYFISDTHGGDRL